MKSSSQRERLGYAFAGIRDGWRRERSFRGHVFCAAAILTGMMIFRPPAIWWMIIVTALGVAFAFELFNGAIEALADHVRPERHPHIRIVKDMAAAAVFIADFTLAVAVAIMAASLWGLEASV